MGERGHPCRPIVRTRKQMWVDGSAVSGWWWEVSLMQCCCHCRNIYPARFCRHSGRTGRVLSLRSPPSMVADGWHLGGAQQELCGGAREQAMALLKEHTELSDNLKDASQCWCYRRGSHRQRRGHRDDFKQWQGTQWEGAQARQSISIYARALPKSRVQCV